jgi:hypothetical protein
MEYENDNSLWTGEGIMACHDGFLYWSSHDVDTGTVKYFRKSISEALK